MSPTFLFILSLVVAFICGGVPFAWWIGLAFFKTDIRKIGSGNPGATNLFREVDRRAGLAALVLDALKGWAPTFWLPALLVPAGAAGLAAADCAALIGVAAIAGHVFSPFLRFRGGKGVATSLGVFIALAPVPIAITVAVVLPIIIATRYVALGSVVAAILFPALVWAMPGYGLLLRVIAAAIGALVIIRHRTNIRRILKGEETKI